ncbi:MAG: hypothetical protein IPK34_08970 [Ramlibacter sp.]|nr:hypothetical protein [Ramlibacter sp.]
MLFVAVAFPLVVVVGGDRTCLQIVRPNLAASSQFEGLNRTFYWLAENRPFWASWEPWDF